jgi:hypothetical protein
LPPLCYAFGAVVVINDSEEPFVQVIENIKRDRNGDPVAVHDIHRSVAA